MAIAQKLAGYTLGKADLLRRAMGKKKKEVLDAEFVGFSDGHEGQRLLRARRSRPCGTSSSRSPTTRSTRRTPPATAWSPTGPPTSRPTTRPSTWPRCSPASATTRTSRRSTSPSAAGWASRCCRRTSTSPTATSPRSAPTSGSAWPRSATSATTSSRRSSRRAQGQGPLRRLPRLPATRSTAVVCNKRAVESLIKAGAFDSLGHTRRALLAVHERGGRRGRRVKRKEAIGQFDLFGGARTTDDGAAALSTSRCPTCAEWDKHDLLAFEREMLGLYVSDHPLFGVEHVLASAADARSRRCCRRGGRADGHRSVTIGGLITGAAAQDHQEGRPWAIATVEDLEGAIEVHVLPGHLPVIARPARRGRRRRGQGPARPPRRRAAADRHASCSLPDLTDGAARPGGRHAAVARCTPPVVERLKEVLATPPGWTEVHLRLQHGGAPRSCGSTTACGSRRPRR